MPDTYRDVEERILEAVEDLQHQDKPNVASTARDFDVPEQRLRKRYQERASKIDVEGQNKGLSEAKELAVCQSINRLDECGLCARPRMLMGIANKVFPFDLELPSFRPISAPLGQPVFSKDT
jgi:transposase-like protein